MLHDPDFSPDSAPSLPPDLDHDQLIHDFICSPESLFELAAAYELTINQLLAWYHSEQTQARLEALEEMADTRARLLAKCHVPTALSRLAEIAATEGNPCEQRRAAAVILRHAAKSAPRPAAAHRPEGSPVGVPQRPSRMNCAAPRAHPPSDRLARSNGAVPHDPPLPSDSSP